MKKREIDRPPCHCEQSEAKKGDTARRLSDENNILGLFTIYRDTISAFIFLINHSLPVNGGWQTGVTCKNTVKGSSRIEPGL